MYISRDVLSEQAISLIQSKTGFTSKVTVCLGSKGLSLNIPFKSFWIRGYLPNDITFVVGKTDDNVDFAVFITEYSHLDSLNNLGRNSAPSLTLALKGFIFLLDEFSYNSNQRMICGEYCLYVLGVHDFISKLITFSDNFGCWNTFCTLCMSPALDVWKEDE